MMVVRDPYTAKAAPTKSLPVSPSTFFESQIAKREATEKLESMTPLPSMGSKVTVYSPSEFNSLI